MTPQRSKVPPPGLHVPCLVFYNEDDTLDTTTIARHAVRMAEGGMAGLVVQGSNGEAVHLDRAERQLAISTTRKALDEHGFSHIPIIAGTGMMSLKETLEVTTEARKAGAEYSLVIAPHYWPTAMSKPVLIDYFTKVANDSVLPVILYNFPAATAGIDMDSDTILTLAKHPNIVGAKFTCANVGKLHRVSSHTSPDNFITIGGKSDFLIHGLVAGMKGATCGLCNLFPKVHVELIKRYETGNMKGALELQNLLSDGDWLATKLGALAGLKLAVTRYFGYGRPTMRSPIPDTSESRLAESDEVFRQLMRLESEL